MRVIDQNITLRQIEPEDYQTYLTMIEESGDSHLWPWIANATIAGMEKFIPGKDYCFIEYDGVPVGAFTFHGKGYRDTIGIGYWLMMQYRRRGWVERILKHIFNSDIAYNAIVHEDNVASNALCRKLGMTLCENKESHNAYTINEISVTG